MLRRFKSILSAAGIIALCAAGSAAFAGAPAAAAREAVVFEAGADTPVVEARKQQRVIVRALVRPAEIGEQRRAPLVVALVLDRSGSMTADGKLENAKIGAMEAINTLGARDLATVVVYDSEASVLVPAKPASEVKTFSRAVSRIRPGGSTALYDGVETGAKELQAFIKEGYIPRIILLSDGMANVGPSSAADLAALGRRLARREMTISTIGLGLDYNEDLMTALAAESGGNSYFARNAEMLPEIFARDMQDAVTLTARKVRVTLSCNGDVRPIRALGREGTKNGNSLEVSIDNLYGSEKYALFEVEIPEREEESVLEAATLRLEYVDAATETTVVREEALKLSFTKDAEAVAKNRQPDIVSQVAIARNAEIREEVIRLADEGRTAEASSMLKSRAEDLQRIAPSAGAAAPKMEAEAQSFESLADELKNGSMSAPQRKETLNKAYMQKNQQTEVKEVK